MARKTKTKPKTPSVLRQFANHYKGGTCLVLMGGVHIVAHNIAPLIVESAERVSWNLERAAMRALRPAALRPYQRAMVDAVRERRLRILDEAVEPIPHGA
jgi:hypothetical protein